MPIDNVRDPKIAEEAGWLGSVDYPPSVILPGRVRRAGGKWFFEQIDDTLWSVRFDREWDGCSSEKRREYEQIGKSCGFSVMKHQYHGIVHKNTWWTLEKEGEGEPLRCWLKHEMHTECLQRMGYNLGSAIRCFQENAAKQKAISPPNCATWSEELQTDIDYLLYQHGLLGQKNRNEYILIDFIQENRHFLSALREKPILFSISSESLIVLEDSGVAVKDWRWVRFGDGVYDLLFLNDLGKTAPSFCKSVLEGYCNGAPTRDVYRRLALYTAIYTLKRLVEVGSGQVHYQDRQEALCHFQQIITAFDSFSTFIPVWAQ